MILADGAKAEAFEALLAAGDLPAISEHVVERGSYRRGTSTFTSTTGPAHVPLLTGCFAGTANVPGYRWFDRARYRGRGPAAPHALRSYNGPEAAWIDRDLAPAHPTLYELVPDSVGVFGVLTRGLTAERNVFSRQKPFIWAHSHWFRDYERADGWAARALSALPSRDWRFAFVAFPGIDWSSHYIGVDSRETLAAYRRVDRAVSEAARGLQAAGRYEETLIAIVSDHGHHRVDQHFDVPVELGRSRGLRTAYHSWPAFRSSFDAVACVSGNGMCHVYLRHGDDWAARPDRNAIAASHSGLIEWLLNEPAVDIVATRDAEPATFVVVSREGKALLAEPKPRGALRYETVGGRDPFGWGDLPSELTPRQALEQTIETSHPDAIAQIAQLFRSGRTGDLVVSAAPGFDLRERFEWPEHASAHGALLRDDMLVPVASSAALEPGPLRTADVAATVLDYLGVSAPPTLDGTTRLHPDLSAARAGGAAVARPARV
jgi:hypothetical protein